MVGSETKRKIAFVLYVIVCIVATFFVVGNSEKIVQPMLSVIEELLQIGLFIGMIYLSYKGWGWLNKKPQP